MNYASRSAKLGFDNCSLGNVNAEPKIPGPGRSFDLIPRELDAMIVARLVDWNFDKLYGMWLLGKRTQLRERLHLALVTRSTEKKFPRRKIEVEPAFLLR